MRRLVIIATAIALTAAACGSTAVEEVAETTAAVSTTTTAAEPTTTTLYEAALVPDGPDETEIVENWGLAFGIGSFAERANTFVGSEDLEGTVESYVRKVEGFGSIVLPVTGVEIEGDTATVTYDVLGNGVAMATELTGEMVVVDGTWKVSRDSFCEAMTLARNPCPAD